VLQSKFIWENCSLGWGHHLVLFFVEKVFLSFRKPIPKELGQGHHLILFSLGIWAKYFKSPSLPWATWLGCHLVPFILRKLLLKATTLKKLHSKSPSLSWATWWGNLVPFPRRKFLEATNLNFLNQCMTFFLWKYCGKKTGSQINHSSCTIINFFFSSYWALSYNCVQPNATFNLLHLFIACPSCHLRFSQKNHSNVIPTSIHEMVSK
jgi:5-methylcytosine-specific restriction endonuclease McrA